MICSVVADLVIWPSCSFDCLLVSFSFAVFFSFSFSFVWFCFLFSSHVLSLFRALVGGRGEPGWVVGRFCCLPRSFLSVPDLVRCSKLSGFWTPAGMNDLFE